MVAIDTLDWLESEANELVRLESNLADMVNQHRKHLMSALYARPGSEEVKRLVGLLEKTDMKGYFRDRHEWLEKG